MRPELELMLYVKQPDPNRACEELDGQVHEQEWPNADKPDQRGDRDSDRQIGRGCADPVAPAGADRTNREPMTQEELVGGAETEHNKRVPVQAVAKPAPDGECLKFMQCQRVDVADSPSVKMARVCMMNRMCAAPVVVRRQRKNGEKPAHPVVRETIAKEGTMSAFDHEIEPVEIAPLEAISW
jgi:hypothetical protein